MVSFHLSTNISTSFCITLLLQKFDKLLVGGWAYLQSTLCPHFIQNSTQFSKFCVNAWFCFDIVLNVLLFLAASFALFWFSCNLLLSLAAAAKLASLHARTVTLSHPFCYTTSHCNTLTESHIFILYTRSVGALLVSCPTRWSLYWCLDFCDDHPVSPPR